MKNTAAAKQPPVVLWLDYLPQSQNRRQNDHWSTRHRLKKKLATLWAVAVSGQSCPLLLLRRAALMRVETQITGRKRATKNSVILSPDGSDSMTTTPQSAGNMKLSQL